MRFLCETELTLSVISAATGDSSIFEYLDDKLVVHHGPEFTVVTNSPVYDEQIALNAYLDQIGGHHMLPGTISAADRLPRASYNLKSSPKFEATREAVTSIVSQMRAVSVPLGMSDP